MMPIPPAAHYISCPLQPHLLYLDITGWTYSHVCMQCVPHVLQLCTLHYTQHLVSTRPIAQQIIGHQSGVRRHTARCTSRYLDIQILYRNEDPCAVQPFCCRSIQVSCSLLTYNKYLFECNNNIFSSKVSAQLYISSENIIIAPYSAYIRENG